MKKLFFQVFAILSVNFFALNAALALSPQAVFSKVSGSVCIVFTNDKDKPKHFGSAVCIANNIVITNFHVVKGATEIAITKGNSIARAKVVASEEDTDIVVLSSEGLAASPIGVRSANSVVVGERVFAIGCPSGLEMTISEGLVSGLRGTDDFKIIQTSAPISKGSSGGGLFDENGELIGLTTFFLSEGQNLNFAIPASYLIKRFSLQTTISNRKPDEPSDFRNGMIPFCKIDNTEAFLIPESVSVFNSSSTSKISFWILVPWTNEYRRRMEIEWKELGISALTPSDVHYEIQKIEVLYPDFKMKGHFLKYFNKDSNLLQTFFETQRSDFEPILPNSNGSEEYSSIIKYCREKGLIN